MLTNYTPGPKPTAACHWFGRRRLDNPNPSLDTTKVATRWWKLGINDKPANVTNAIGWDTLDQPQDEHDNGSSGETGDEAEEENGGE